MSWIGLKAQDGQDVRAWEAAPEGKPLGAIVVLQEIFGVNAHIRALCDRYAAQGWLALAPSLFDRAGGPALGLGYQAEDMAQGRALKGRLTDEQALLDVNAAIDHASVTGLPVAVIGFCWGGTLAWLSACRNPKVTAAVAYYGTNIAGYRTEKPRVPVLLHFGEQDTHIPQADVQTIADAQPQVRIHRYDAGHGFNCDERPAFHASSAALAADRTFAFLKEHLSC